MESSKLDKAFEKNWPDLEKHLLAIPKLKTEATIQRSQEDMFREILAEVRSLSKNNTALTEIRLSLQEILNPEYQMATLRDLLHRPQKSLLSLSPQEIEFFANQKDKAEPPDDTPNNPDTPAPATTAPK